MTEKDFLARVMAEAAYGRLRFPETANNALAHAEEAGELSKAVLDYGYGKETKDGLLREAVQAAAMAMRVALEGDSNTAWPGYSKAT